MQREQLLPGMSSCNIDCVEEKERNVVSFIFPVEKSNYKIHNSLSLLTLILLSSE